MFKNSTRKTLSKSHRVASYDIVVPDTNVLVTYVMSKSDKTPICAVFQKVKESDTLVVTNQIMQELYSLDLSKKKVSKDDVTRALRKLQPTMVFVCNPSDEELSRFTIDDEDDKRILYSAKQVNAKIILTDDKAWFRDNVSGADVEIMDPYGYMHYEEIKTGAIKMRDPTVGRIKRVFSRRE